MSIEDLRLSGHEISFVQASKEGDFYRREIDFCIANEKKKNNRFLTTHLTP
jgi:hypothetical protein